MFVENRVIRSLNIFEKSYILEIFAQFFSNKHPSGKTPADVTKEKIMNALVNISKDDESKTRFTNLIILNIRELPLNLIDKSEDKKLIDQICQNFMEASRDLAYEQYDWVAMSNLLWLIQSYADKIHDSPYILEEIIDHFQKKNATANQNKEQYMFFCSLLSSGIRIFTFYPSETQHILGKVFELCKNQNSTELEEKVVFYSKLLQCDTYITHKKISENV